MKNIELINPFKSTTKETDFGILTLLETEIEISSKGSIVYDGKSLLSNYIYDKQGSYKLVYTIIHNDGKNESYEENNGILPTLFLSPQLENYVSIVPYDPNKELEISVPVFDRENTEFPKGNRPFVGDFIGVSNQYSIFFDRDIWSDTKPDKILAIEFKEKAIKKKHNIKVPLPRNNKIFISNNEIHLLAHHNSMFLHRQIDEKGNILKERELKSNFKYFNQVLHLSFEETSYILCQQKEGLFIEKINTDGEHTSKLLLDFTDNFYNTWKPEKIAKDTNVIRFNTEFGNGWFSIKNDILLEFFYSKDTKGYRDLITNKILEIPIDNLVISSINKTREKNYLVVFYPLVEKQIKNNKLITLNRSF